MIAYLITYWGEDIHQIDTINVDDNYDGDPYGDHVPFTVGSNQTIIVRD